MSFLLGVAVGIIGLLIWKQGSTPNIANVKSVNGKIINDVLDALKDVQQRPMPEEDVGVILRQQQAKLRARIRDRINVKRGLEKEDIPLVDLEEMIGRALRKAEEEEDALALFCKSDQG